MLQQLLFYGQFAPLPLPLGEVARRSRDGEGFGFPHPLGRSWQKSLIFD